MHSIVATYCSKRKRQDGRVLMPAIERYAGKHIVQAQQLAITSGRDLMFLSALYGLIDSTDQIIWYDEPLTVVTPHFVARVCEQLQSSDVHDIWWFSEATPAVQAYDVAMQRAVERLRTKLYDVVLHPYVHLAEAET